MPTIVTFSTEADLMSRVDRFLAEGKSRRSSGTEPEFSKSRSSFITHAVRLLLDSVDLDERPSDLPALVQMPEAEDRPSLTKAIFDALEKDTDRWWTPDLIRAFVRMVLPSVTLRDIKDTLVVMEFEGLIEEERDRLSKRLKRFRSHTVAGVPAKAAVDAGLTSFDFAAHEAARAAKLAKAEQEQAAITQSRAGTKAELLGQLKESTSNARRLEESYQAARGAFLNAEKRANAEHLAAHPKPDTMGGDPEILKLSLEARSALVKAWAVGRASHVEAVIAPLRAESERLHVEAKEARLRSDAIAARLEELEHPTGG